MNRKNILKWFNIRQLTIGVVIFITPTLLGVTIKAIDFSGVGRNSEIEVSGNGPLLFTQEKGTKDQVILKIEGELSADSKRSFDGSVYEFSPVKEVKAYSDPKNKKTSKLVINLSRDIEDLDVHREGNSIKVRIPNDQSPKVNAMRDALKVSAAAPGDTPGDTQGNITSPSTDSAAEPSAPDLPPIAPAEPTALTAPAAPELSAEPTASAFPDNPKITPPSPPQNAAQGTMDQFIRNRDSKSFTGRPITLKVKEAELMDVFRLIGETSGFNIVMSDNVRGKVTLNMEGVPWDQVLDVILKTHQLGAERNGNLLRIATLQDLTAEKTQELNAQKATEAITPKITKIFSISYANLEDLSKILTSFTQANSSNAAAGASPAIVQSDKRTNSIIVKDVAENIEKMKKLIELLDTQTPQIMIEAKIVEASESFQKSMGGAIGLNYKDPQGQTRLMGGFNTSDPTSSLTGGTASTSAITPGGGNRFGYSPDLGFLKGVTVNALLNLAESENSIKVISSPKTVVLDHETANILSSTPVVVPVALSSTTGASTSGDEIKQANLSMTVTPSVTNEGSVLLTLSLSRDVPQKAEGSDKTGVANRNMTTKVIVDSGSTLVIGGIYSFKTAESGSGFPGLRKLPLIGFLFGSETKETSKTELFFFITPRILNPREAGLNG